MFNVRFVDLVFHETIDPSLVIAEFRSRGTAVPTGKPYEHTCISVVQTNDDGLFTPHRHVRRHYGKSCLADAHGPARTSTESDEGPRAVLAAAICCFAKKGLYGTTTHEIAESMGICQPYLYCLYPNKEALFASAVDHVSVVMNLNSLRSAKACCFRSVQLWIHSGRTGG